MTDDERAIRELVGKWMEASRNKDIETVLDLMSDDVVFMAPAREPFGKEEFRAAAAAMSRAKIDGRAEVLEIRVLDDWAWVRSHIEIMVTSLGGEPVHRSGYTLSILQKCTDGRWRLARCESPDLKWGYRRHAPGPTACAQLSGTLSPFFSIEDPMRASGHPVSLTLYGLIKSK